MYRFHEGDAALRRGRLGLRCHDADRASFAGGCGASAPTRLTNCSIFPHSKRSVLARSSSSPLHSLRRKKRNRPANIHQNARKAESRENWGLRVSVCKPVATLISLVTFITAGGICHLNLRKPLSLLAPVTVGTGEPKSARRSSFPRAARRWQTEPTRHGAPTELARQARFVYAFPREWPPMPEKGFLGC
jgi:hypothetical protein